MTTMKMKLAIVLMACGTIFFSCKKDKEQDKPTGCTVNMENLAGSYRLTALQYKETANATPVDYLAPMEDCEKDDILTLKSDGTYSYADAGTVCTPSRSDNGTWQLKDNVLTSDGTLNGTVAAFDCKTLTYYVENSLKTGDRLTFTLVKQ